MTASYQNLASQAAATGAPRNWRPWRRRALWAGGLIWAWSVLIITGLQADPIDRAVMLSAAVTNDPPTITLNWQLTRQDDADYIYIFRSQDALIGGSQIAYLEGPDHTNFTDTNVVVGQAYHYSAIASIGGRHTAQGYISSGIDVPLADSRGTVILILDGGFSQSLEDEYDLLAQNLAGDGWTVERYDVPRAYRPFDIRNTIRTAYSNDPDNVKSVFLFGRIPVVLSGPVCPDGHIEEHTVHYATDAFYADMHVEVTNYFPDSTDYWQPDAIGYFSNRAAYTDLAIGRVDLSFLPAMGDEAELLKQYIQKNHNYRHRLFEWQAKGFIHDEFGDYADDAKVGWRDFSAILGHTNVMAGWWRTLREPPFLWGYGCGGGYYNSCGNVINTGQMKTHDPAVFTFLFGSYFCDWYTANNLLRAQLATPEHGLTCAWGDAHVVSSMGLGGCIGECIKIRQNKGGVHVGLMGDPTLRIQYITPPSNLVADTQNHLLQWDPVPEEGIMEGELEGYNIYRSLNRYGPFTRLNHSPIQDTSYIMDDPTAQQHYYMVRAVALLDHNSGRYYDASQGIFTSAIFTPPLVPSASGGNHADKIAVSWTPQHDTLAYEVWRSQYYRDPSLAEMVAVTTSTNYDDTEVTPSIFYYYWIKAQTPLGTTDFDLSAEGWRSWVSTPTDVMASDGSYRDKVLISWTPSPNAIDYV
ncbi:MAG: hypothetical protein GX806_05730, partial [Lentisphaerae bacterium]|nr:hypothetical protein [Lentisphaerota bacterium]